MAHGAAIVEAQGGSYRAAESIGMILSDGSYYELIAPGTPVNDGPRTVSLSLVEDARQANIIIEKRAASTSSRAERVLAFGVPTQGFDLETLSLRYQITADQMFCVSVESESIRRREERQFGQLLFTYHFA